MLDVLLIKRQEHLLRHLFHRTKVKLLEETKSKMSLDDLFNQIQEGNLKELDIVVKADVQGSVEAIKQSLLKLSNDEVVVKIIHGGVGQSTNLMSSLHRHPMRSLSVSMYVRMRLQKKLQNAKV